MHLLVISMADVGDSFNSHELEVERVYFSESTHNIAAEQVRARFNLGKEHRETIVLWIQVAGNGDLLLVNTQVRMVRGVDTGVRTDDIALVMCKGDQPVISRLVFEEVRTTEARLQTLPPNAKRVTRASKKAKSKIKKK